MTTAQPIVDIAPEGVSAADHRSAVIYRMVMPTHTCPFGLKALDLLKRRGLQVDDRWITTREEQDAVKARYGVKTTPQVFIGGQRVGGWDDLRRHFGISVPDPKAPSYRPVVAVFSVAALIAVAVTAADAPGLAPLTLLHRFVAISMCLLAMLKLQDLGTFSTMFLNYDLLSRRVVRYAYVYPFAELAAGVLMLSGLWPVVGAIVALGIGGVGAVSVIKAVYVDKRELKCACVGGSAPVPLGFVSLTENLMMVGMGVWGLAQVFGGR